MGQPLSPTFVNIFLCFQEEKWLSSCPHFKPVFYRRYIDDTFLVFKHSSHVPLFLNYLNNKHPNIKFTSETEISNKLPFLDCNIHRVNNTFETSVYRKNTFSGLGISNFSFCSNAFKLNSIPYFLGLTVSALIISTFIMNSISWLIFLKIMVSVHFPFISKSIDF